MYVAAILAYGLLTGIGFAIISKHYTDPANILGFCAAWIIGFVWLNGYLLLGPQTARRLVIACSCIAAGMAAVTAPLWLL